MNTAIDYDVLIVGAGPVGMAAAAHLSSRGVRCAVVERRAAEEPADVKSNHVSSRTMERFRQLGIADKVRAAGLPTNYPHDISFRTRMCGQEVSRITLPSPEGRQRNDAGDDTSWSTPEPPHRINQRYLEPVLREVLAGLAGVTPLFSHEFVSADQTGSLVRVSLRDLTSGDDVEVTAQYLLGCDGAKSSVRKLIGAKLQGDPVLQHVQSTCIKAPGLYEAMGDTPAWGYYVVNPERKGHIYSIDGTSVFLVHNYLTDEEHESGSVDRETSLRAILGSSDLEVEMLSTEDWVARRLVADKLREGRIFLAGDAAHLWVPMAGYGMNAGIADSLNLSWLIAAVVEGWADAKILDAYEAERLPITEQVSKFAMGHALTVKDVQNQVPANIEEEGPEGAASREAYGELLYRTNVPQFAAEGLNFGYVYDASPIISYDQEAAPSYSMGEYQPSTVPGCRAPHFWLEDGGSLYDALGPGYTLIRIEAEGIAADLIESAAARGVPLRVLDVTQPDHALGYRTKLVIVRHDQHVVWRGDEVTAPEELIELLRGNKLQQKGE